MDEKFEFPSSQDDELHSSQELLSQETFELLWRETYPSMLAGFATDVNNLDSCNINDLNQQQGMPNENIMNGALQPNLDSCNINDVNQQQGMPNENVMNGALQQNDHIAVSSVQLSPPLPPVSSNIHQGSSSLPACETWPGDFNFTLSFSPQEKNTKGIAWTYSRIIDKLYVGKDAPCPINFSVKTVLPNDVYIRVMALYTSPEQVTEVVKRCINHSTEEVNRGKKEAEHLIRCESTTATYYADTVTGRHSVVVPFENPPAGQPYSTYIYKFACFGSCAGGPNRRPLMLIFTLERGNQVIGRRKLDVKICACPGRDRKSDEAQRLATELPNQRIVLPIKRKVTSDCINLSEIMDFTKSVYFPPPKKNKIAPNKDGLYTVDTEDRECYDFLQQMKNFFGMAKIMKNVPSDILQKACHHFNQKIKTEKSD